MPDPATDRNREIYLRLVESQVLIGGRFKNVRRVDPRGGHGWFSLVFTADDTKTGDSVVIKAFHPHERGDGYRWACFKREARILDSLRGQPDIIQMIAPLDEFVENVDTGIGLQIEITFAYYVLEQAASNLEAKVANKELDHQQLLIAFRAMCRSIRRLQARGIAHRDIKPSNFLVMSDGSIKLGDFGTARDFGAEPALLAPYDRWPGDTSYTAPEMLAGLHDRNPRIAFKADIFSLGATLFEMFSGVVLSTQLFDPSFVADVSKLIVVPAQDRERIFGAIIDSIVAGYRFPELDQAGADIPGSIRRRIDSLYRAMAALDYRSREDDFETIFRRIDICVLILRNQETYDRWRAERQKRMDNSSAKKAALASSGAGS